MKIVTTITKDWLRNLTYTRKIQGMFYKLEPEEDYMKEIKKQIKNE